MPDLIRIDSKTAAKRLEDAPRVDIFEVDGKVYSVAAVTRADIGLEYMAKVEEEGVEEAQAWMIRMTVGDEGFQALRGVKGLDPDDWRAIRKRIEGLITPKAQGPRD